MLNKEKYHDEIFEIACNRESVAVVDGKPIPCDGDCFGCDFCSAADSDCRDRFRRWCNSEYVEPPVDWSVVEIDAPVIVQNEDGEQAYNRHFAKYEDGHVYVWADGKTSWSTSRVQAVKSARLK